MSQTSFFCSELSRRAGEPAFGTASVGGLWLLLEYPYPWGPHALPDSNLAPAVKKFLQRTLREIPRARLLFIKRERGCEGGINFFVVRCREREPFVVRFELQQYEELTEIDVVAPVGAGAPDGGTLWREPLFLVCTHGKRDKCCALHGRPLYKALRRTEGDNVWQSSHVGGDRFAGNLVCFPHGLFYGRATEETGPRLAREYRERRLVLEDFRGRACYPYHVQAADFFVRAETGLRGLDDLRLLDSKRTADKSWVIKFKTTGDHAQAHGAAGAAEHSAAEPSAREASAHVTHEASVTCRDSEIENYITCHATEPRRTPRFRLDAYRLLRESAHAQT